MSALHHPDVATVAVATGLGLGAAVVLYSAHRNGVRREERRARQMRRVVERVELEVVEVAASAPRSPIRLPRRVERPQRPVVPPGYTRTHDGTLIRRAG